MEERTGASKEEVEECPGARRLGSEKVPGEHGTLCSAPWEPGSAHTSHMLAPPTPSSVSQDLRQSGLWGADRTRKKSSRTIEEEGGVSVNGSEAVICEEAACSFQTAQAPGRAERTASPGRSVGPEASAAQHSQTWS